MSLGLALWLAACTGGSPVVEPPRPERTASQGAPQSDLPEVWPVVSRVRVTSPYAVAPDAEAVRRRELLLDVVRRNGLDPENGWSLSHALLAMGAEARLPDGAMIVDHLFARFAERRPGGGLSFPRKAGGHPVEPHEGLVVKTLIELEVPPERVVRVQGEPATVADLWRGQLAEAWVAGDQMAFSSWKDTPWTLQALATWAPPGLTWTAAGRAMQLDAFTHAVVDQLVADTAFLSEARASGTAFQKRGQGIFGHPCGGAHLLQGVASAVAYGFGEPGDAERLREQASLVVWRFPRELAILDDALARAPQDLHLILHVQRLKFAGHHLETVHRLAALGLLPPGDAEVADSLAQARSALAGAVTSIVASGALEQMSEVRRGREQTFLDLVGDSAHAAHGLALDAGVDGILR